MEEYPKKDAPHIKSSFWTPTKISNPMGIGFGTDDVTWTNIQKWIPPTSNLHVGLQKTKSKHFNPRGIGLGIDYVAWRNAKTRMPPHQIFIRDTKYTFQSYTLGIDDVTWRNVQK